MVNLICLKSFRKVFQEYHDFYFRLTSVREIDSQNKKVITEIGDLSYDYLVIATGSKTNYFGNKEIERNSMAMKTIPQSLNIRSLILENFEQAVLLKDQAEKEKQFLGIHAAHELDRVQSESGPHAGKLICKTCNNKFLKWLPKEAF